jgi:hypothetical protein
MDPHALAEVLRDAKALISLEENDFSWSSWADATDALAEIDAHLDGLETGQMLNSLDLEVIFAAAGPMQEVAVSSGWGPHFILLADRFDSAMVETQATERHANSYSAAILRGFNRLFR